MDFTGKVCPYCKTEFKEGDDIVVCSVCEMPHHKECWIENKACTTFGCTGVIMGADQPEKTANNKKFCAKCGSPLNAGQKFCGACGALIDDLAGNNDGFNSLYNTEQNHRYNNVYTQLQQSYVPQNTNFQYNTGYNQPYQQQVDQDLYTFIQTNQDVYMSKFQKMQMSNTKVSWNWCSFLFGSCWYAFRKMYGIAAAYVGIAFVVGLIPGIGFLFQLALYICSGIFGDFLYKQYIDGELKLAKSMDYLNKSIYIAKKGGTSIGSVFVLIGISFVIELILSII